MDLATGVTKYMMGERVSTSILVMMCTDVKLHLPLLPDVAAPPSKSQVGLAFVLFSLWLFKIPELQLYSSLLFDRISLPILLHTHHL